VRIRTLVAALAAVVAMIAAFFTAAPAVAGPAASTPATQVQRQAPAVAAPFVRATADGNHTYTRVCYYNNNTASSVKVTVTTYYSNRHVQVGPSRQRQSRVYGIYVHPGGGSIAISGRSIEGLSGTVAYWSAGPYTLPSAGGSLGYSTNTMPWLSQEYDLYYANDVRWKAYGVIYSCDNLTARPLAET
jgi:hypothetical protein